MLATVPISFEHMFPKNTAYGVSKSPTLNFNALVLITRERHWNSMSVLTLKNAKNWFDLKVIERQKTEKPKYYSLMFQPISAMK